MPDYSYVAMYTYKYKLLVKKVDTTVLQVETLHIHTYVHIT